MKTAKEWFEEELSGEPLTQESIIEVIKMVQIDTVEEIVGFAEYIGKKELTFYKDSWFDKDNHSLDCDTKELFKNFIREKNGKVQVD